MSNCDYSFLAIYFYFFARASGHIALFHSSLSASSLCNTVWFQRIWRLTWKPIVGLPDHCYSARVTEIPNVTLLICQSWTSLKDGERWKGRLFLQYSKFQWAVMPCWLPALHLPLGRVWLGVEDGGAGDQICSMIAPWGSGLIGCTHRVVTSVSALPWFSKHPSLQNSQVFQDLQIQPNKLEVWFQNTLSFLRTTYIYVMSVNQATGPRH